MMQLPPDVARPDATFHSLRCDLSEWPHICIGDNPAELELRHTHPNRVASDQKLERQLRRESTSLT